MVGRVAAEHLDAGALERPVAVDVPLILAIEPSGSVEAEASKPTVCPGRTARPGTACSHVTATAACGAWASPPRRTIALRFCSLGVWLVPAAIRRPCGVTASAAMRSRPPADLRLAALAAVRWRG